MPDRHFYLLRHHISFYIKFLLFCLLAPDEIMILCRKNKGDPQKIMINQRTISPLENSSKSQRLPIAPISFTIISLQFRKKISPSGDFHSNENHRLLDNPLIPIQDLNTNFHLEPKTEKRKFDIEENVMSEPVKMPVRHFLCRDYLHIFSISNFYFSFL